jgi:YesN/AraC family two-component response regulator
MIACKPGKKLNVLVVDDEADIRDTLVSFLEMMEVFTHIIEANDGAEAYRKFQNQDFDVVITDLQMPKAKGIELVKNIKEMEKKKNVERPSSIIILSGNLTGIEVKKAIQFGVKHVLAKPCKSEDFVNKVEEVLLKERKNKIVTAPD